MAANKLNVNHWLVYKTERVFLTSAPRKYKPLELDVARNEVFSFQAAFRLSDGMNPIEFNAEVEAPAGWSARIRRVGPNIKKRRTSGYSAIFTKPLRFELYS